MGEVVYLLGNRDEEEWFVCYLGKNGVRGGRRGYLFDQVWDTRFLLKMYNGFG